MKQALRVARTATPDLRLQRRILDETALRLPELDLENSPAEVSQCAYDIAMAVSGNDDPFSAARAEQNAMALALEGEMEQLVASSEQPLLTALHIAAAGNIIDLGIMHSEHIDVRGAVEQALNERFAVDDSARLLEELEKCSDLLFFLDNAGEIVFDKILIKELLKRTPVTAVVKGAPIINDAVMDDAERVGLTRLCDVIDNGGAFIGSPLGAIPVSLRERMDRAHVTIGKGQGNYETLDSYPGDVFLILKAKCEVVARHMGVALGQVGLISTSARRSRALEV